MSYNGWTNRETWNVTLWMQNDETLYEIACSRAGSRDPWQDFKDIMSDMGISQTPDGVRWDDPAVDGDEVTDMMFNICG